MRRSRTLRRSLTTGATILIVLILTVVGYSAYEAYPFGRPLARAMAGDQQGDLYEVVIHSVEKAEEDIHIYITVRWVGEGAVPYFGFMGQWVILDSQEELEAGMAVHLSDARYPWQKHPNRTSAVVSFAAPTSSGPVSLTMQFVLDGRIVQCELPFDVPDS